MNIWPRHLAAALLLAAALAAPATAQVVIRERVEVRSTATPSAAALDAPPDATGCSGPVVAHAVYWPGYGPGNASVTQTFGAPLAGTLTVTTPCGTYAADLAPAYVLTGSGPYLHAPSLTRYDYAPDPAAEILRVPLHRAEPVETAAYVVAGDTFTVSYDGDAPSWPDSGGRPFGCQGSGCNGSSPGTLAGAVVSAYAGVDGTATAALVGEWPSTVVCGSETALVTWGVDEDGAEGWLPPALGVLGFLYSPGGGTFDDPGHLVTDTEAGLMVSTDIAALAGGGVQYAAPACDVVTDPFEIGVGFMATANVVSGTGTITVLPAGAGGTPDTLIVSVTPGTLGPGEAAAVTAVAQADGSDVPDGTIPDDAPMAVAVSSVSSGRLEYQGSRSGVFDVPYGDLQSGQVTFVADGPSSCGGTVTITAVGVGVSGSMGLVIQASAGVSDSDDEGCDGEPAPRQVTQQEVYDWFGNECQIDVSTQPGKQEANLRFTDVIAHAFGVPLEGRKVRPGGWNPVDGYIVQNGYTTHVFETKNVGRFAFRNRKDIDQAKNHIDRLVAHREALRRNAIDEHGNASISVTAPTYVVVTTSPESRLDTDNEILNHAREKGVNLHVYRLYERLFFDWYLRGERLNVVFGGYNDWYVGVPLAEIPDWADWFVPGVDALRDLDNEDVQMACEPVVVRKGAPPPPGGYPAN